MNWAREKWGGLSTEQTKPSGDCINQGAVHFQVDVWLMKCINNSEKKKKKEAVLFQSDFHFERGSALKQNTEVY